MWIMPRAFRAFGPVATAVMAAGVLLWLHGPAAGEVVVIGRPQKPAGGASLQRYVADSPDAEDLINAARLRLRGEQFTEAAKVLQQLIDEHGRRLVSDGEGRYVEAAHAAAQILTASEPLRAAYLKLHEAIAARQLVQAGHDPAALNEVRQRYEVTEAGLQAALRLAALRLESADFAGASGALRALDAHPQIDAYWERWHFLRGAAALFESNDDGYADALSALRDRSEAGRALAGRLETLADDLQRPAVTPIRQSLDRLPDAGSPSAAPRRALWSLPLGRAPVHSTPTLLLGGNVLVGEVEAEQGVPVIELPRAATTPLTIPVVHGPTVYFSNKANVWAVDRDGGRIWWRYQSGEHSLEAEMLRTRFGAHLFNRFWYLVEVEAAYVEAAGDRVLAVMSHWPDDLQVLRRQTPMPNKLVCLAASDGRRLWQRRPGQLHEDLGNGVWYGRPIVAGRSGDGAARRAYLMVRRLQSNMPFLDVFIVAVDLSDGSLLWHRQAASAASAARRIVPASSDLLLHDGWLYADCGFGVHGRIDAADGRIDWLTLNPLASEPPASQRKRQPINVAAARTIPRSALILCGAGLISHDRAGKVIRVLDPADGSVRHTIPAKQWQNPEYLVPDRGDILAIGKTVHRYDGQTLKLAWPGPFTGPSALVGRVCIAGKRLYLLTEDGIVVVDADDGSLLDVLDDIAPGNLVVMADQVLSAKSDEVESYSAWSTALSALRGRIDSPGHDAVRARLALAHLAYRTDRNREAMAALDEAAAVLELRSADDPARRGLFEQLMEMATDEATADAELRRMLFERVGRIVQTTQDEVTYRMAFGRFLESTGDVAEAVETYQHVLGSAALRRQLYAHGGGARQAALEARRRLKQLTRKHGDGIYEPYELYAREQLEVLSGQGDAAALVELAEAYPLAGVAVEALVLAGERYRQAGDGQAAARLLSQASAMTDDPARQLALTSRQIEWLIEAGQGAEARRMLVALSLRRPDAPLMRQGEPTTPTQWLAHLDARPASTYVRPQLPWPFADDAVVLSGRLMGPRGQRPRWPQDRFVILDDREVVLYRSEDLTELWRVPVAARPVKLLAMDEHRLWLWHQGQLRVRVLDAHDGSAVWQSGPMDETAAAQIPLGPDIQPGRAAEQQLQQALARARVRMLRGDNAQPAILISTDRVVLAVADRAGRLLVYDARNGDLIWGTNTGLTRTSHLRTAGGFAIVAGWDKQSSPTLCIFDARDGTLVHRLSQSQRQPIYDTALLPDRKIVYTNMREVIAFDPMGAGSAWVCKLPGNLRGRSIRAGADQIAVITHTRDLLLIDALDGQKVVQMPLRHLGEETQVRASGDSWLIVGPLQCTMLDQAGRIVWDDAISEPKHLLTHTLNSDEHILLVSNLREAMLDGPGRVGAESQTCKLYILDRAGGAVLYERTITGISAIDRLAHCRNKVLLSSANRTIVLTAKP